MFRRMYLGLCPQSIFVSATTCLCFATTSAFAVLPSTVNKSAVGAQTLSDIVDFQILKTPYPYEFPEAKDVINLFPMPMCNGITLEEATIDSLQDAMHSGILTSSQIVSCYLRRIYQTDSYIEAIMELNPDFMEIAAALDTERATGRVRGSLHGIPFLVKDNIATKDKMETTAGSWALLGSVVPRDSHVVARLREAGALLLGHATLSEWADMRSSNYSEGYSARGGQARSPYNLTTNPGGSSSGSAAAVAANLCTFALGTETDGSVINPAERNALVGIKPTVGLTSRAGVIPESSHQDTVGTFGRTVRDAVYALDAIYGIDPRDNYTSAQRGKTPPGGYAQFLADRSALKGATFGLPWNSFWVYASEEMYASLNELTDLMQQAGARIINGTELPNYKTTVSPHGWNWDYGATRGYPNESEFTVVKVDFYNNIKTYLAELENTNIRSLEDIVQWVTWPGSSFSIRHANFCDQMHDFSLMPIRYNINNTGTEGGEPNVHPAFASGQDDFLASLDTKGIMDETYYQALAFCQKTTREDGIDAALNHGGTQLSGLLVPPDVGQTYQIAAQAGYPIVTLPAGITAATGMPFGLAVMNTAWSEATLVKYASAIEDLQRSSGTKYKRTVPLWHGYKEKNIPVY